MENLIAEKTVNSYTIKIYQDNDPTDPREWDNLGKMVCFHRGYSLGDEKEFKDPEDFQEYLQKNHKKIIYLPLYLYDHSGITISTKPFSCQWDSGQVGYIYITYEDIRKEYNTKKVTKEIKEKVLAILKLEVEIYDRYLTGQVFGFVVEDNKGEVIDSCWGYFDTPEEIIEYVEETVVKYYDYQLEISL